jgi:hypothetical protein
MRDLAKINMWCPVMKNIISPSFSEEHMVTGEKFLAMMEVTALHHIPAGAVFECSCLSGREVN